ncbi:MFS transporter [Nonomuraea salmonea]|uniref:MFS transporter n=1 Tax=Nonomuraea salmonea TaxID=46181 RepID=UPI0031E92608
MIGRLLVCTAGAFLSIGLLIPAVPRYLDGPLGRQPGMVGVSLAVTAAAGVLARPLAGRVADRLGRRAALCAGGAAAVRYVPRTARRRGVTAVPRPARRRRGRGGTGVRRSRHAGQ